MTTDIKANEEQQLEKLKDFIEGYRLKHPASVIMGESLIKAITEYLTPEVLQTQTHQITEGKLDRFAVLNNTDQTKQFFSKHQKLIKKWLKRVAKEKGMRTGDIVTYFSHHAALPSNERFSGTNLKAVLIDNDQHNQQYNAIANAVTKYAAIAVAQNYIDFDYHWIPF